MSSNQPDVFETTLQKTNTSRKLTICYIAARGGGDSGVLNNSSCERIIDMAKCELCGNDYDKSFEIKVGGKTHVFDSFECAIAVVAPNCSHCDCKIIGHGVEASSGKIFCCANCARLSGETKLRDRS